MHTSLHQFYALQEPSGLEAAASLSSAFFIALGHVVPSRQPDLVRTAIGSCPGGYTDIVFGFLWSKLLRAYETELVAHDLIEKILVFAFPSLV